MQKCNALYIFFLFWYLIVTRLTQVYSFFQLCEGLTFLHDSAKLLHRNLSPDSIVLNEAGAWKIFGFDFCLSNQSSGGLISKRFFALAHIFKKSAESLLVALLGWPML